MGLFNDVGIVSYLLDNESNAWRAIAPVSGRLTGEPNEALGAR
jgi:hypothetical protein